MDRREYYCATCADRFGERPEKPTVDMLGTDYQKGKHQKHTQQSSSYGIQSVFDSTSTQYYQECIEEAFEKGAIEVYRGRRSILFPPSTGSDIGTKYRWGVAAQRADTILVAHATSAGLVHAMLEESSRYSGETCKRCGRPIL